MWNYVEFTGTSKGGRLNCYCYYGVSINPNPFNRRDFKSGPDNYSKSIASFCEIGFLLKLVLSYNYQFGYLFYKTG